MLLISAEVTRGQTSLCCQGQSFTFLNKFHLWLKVQVLSGGGGIMLYWTVAAEFVSPRRERFLPSGPLSGLQEFKP